MGKLLQRAPKSTKARAPKKAAAPPNRRGGAKKLARKPTLRQVNRWLTENHEEVLRRAKENCRRLTGQDVL